MAALDPAAFEFVDESGTHTSLTRLRARAPRGQRAVGVVPRNHGPNVTPFAAPTPAGIGPALAMPGAADGEGFGRSVRELLVPSPCPGRVVTMGQLDGHKGTAAREAIEAAGCRRLPPPYPPDLTPSEQAFAEVKAHLRATAARTF